MENDNQENLVDNGRLVEKINNDVNDCFCIRDSNGNTVGTVEIFDAGSK